MEVKNLCKAYGDRPVLENVSFTVGVGVTALWGPSGVGKTTLLRDLIRAVSDGEGGPALRVGVADERGELAAMLCRLLERQGANVGA